MIVILGLILLIAAVVVGVAAVVTNVGTGHELTQVFTVFGYHVTGSTGALFLFGVIVGAVGVLGLSMLLAGLRRSPRRERRAVLRDADAPSADTRRHRRPHLFGHRTAHR
ncbi:hypothetical protein [Streptomyces sp. NPDC048644]|uniref:hypothetical protein n=1 Tax=Streptomyces sp. NPDC048644 TaxID=3365582 RepID=UPI0037114FE3